MNKSMFDAETQRAEESGGAPPDVLGDFRTNRRALVLSALEVPIGIISALVAKAQFWLIAVITGLFFFHRLSTQTLLPEHSHLGWWLPLVKSDEPDRVEGYLGHADILGARMRHHEEEEVRGKGPWRNHLNGWKFWPVNS